jgi:hypothetical protein
MRWRDALFAALAVACTTPRPARTDAPTPQGTAPVTHATDARPSLPDAAAHHLAAHAPSDRPLVLFLSVGAGEASAQLAAQLRDALATRARVIYATASSTPGAPMPSTEPGSHVQSVTSAVTPWPDRVVRVSVSSGTSSIAVRLTGSDPLGPAEQGWEWFETRP